MNIIHYNKTDQYLKEIGLNEIKSKAEKFINDGNFLGMPKHYTNRNEIRWYALNEFLGSKLITSTNSAKLFPIGTTFALVSSIK